MCVRIVCTLYENSPVLFIIIVIFLLCYREIHVQKMNELHDNYHEMINVAGTPILGLDCTVSGGVFGGKSLLRWRSSNR